MDEPFDPRDPDEDIMDIDDDEVTLEEDELEEIIESELTDDLRAEDDFDVPEPDFPSARQDLN